MLEPTFFKKTIDSVYKELIYLTFYFQGEPYLNPHFLEMVKYASDKKIYTSTSTNAHYLTQEMARKTVESKLDRLIISIDGTNHRNFVGLGQPIGPFLGFVAQTQLQPLYSRGQSQQPQID